jgi:hypothetical protein
MKNRYPGFPLNKRLIETKEYGDCSFKIALLVGLPGNFGGQAKARTAGFCG